MEYIDIVDKNNNVVGRTTRDLPYVEKHPHRIVHVLLFNDKGELLMQKRSQNVTFWPGAWGSSVGGHVQSGESYEEAAMREFSEELGTQASMKLVGVTPFVSEAGMTKFLGVF